MRAPAARWAIEFVGTEEVTRLSANNDSVASPWGNNVAIITFFPFFANDFDETTVSMAESQTTSAEQNKCIPAAIATSFSTCT
mmetsp:Transcript_8995/g.21912  ORF Transcript_8995/g.21912 Transcript_8995/m.21912 type:complete len:83 (-) Transcript_8995:1581-1829(-)